MFTSYVLITTKSGQEENVLNNLKKIIGVTEAYTVFGVYDIIAKIEAETVEEVKRILPREVRKLKDVQSALTMIISDYENPRFV